MQISDELTDITNDFISKLSAIARDAAISMLESAFRGNLAFTTLSVRGAHGGANGGQRVAAAALLSARSLIRSTADARPDATAPRPRNAKRRQDDIDELSSQFLSFVAANPGLRVEQINKQMGSTTRDLALPIRRLVAAGDVVVKGEKRSTTYFVSKR